MRPSSPVWHFFCRCWFWLSEASTNSGAVAQGCKRLAAMGEHATPGYMRGASAQGPPTHRSLAPGLPLVLAHEVHAVALCCQHRCVDVLQHLLCRFDQTGGAAWHWEGLGQGVMLDMLGHALLQARVRPLGQRRAPATHVTLPG